MDTREAVRRFVVRARERAGGSDELGQAMAPFYGRVVPSGTVRAWCRRFTEEERGPNDPGGHALFAMLRAFPDLSLDEYALAPEEVTGLRAALAEVQEIVDELQERVTALEIPAAQTSSGTGATPGPGQMSGFDDGSATLS